jgi:hypothetical protein
LPTVRRRRRAAAASAEAAPRQCRCGVLLVVVARSSSFPAVRGLGGDLSGGVAGGLTVEEQDTRRRQAAPSNGAIGFSSRALIVFSPFLLSLSFCGFPFFSLQSVSYSSFFFLQCFCCDVMHREEDCIFFCFFIFFAIFLFFLLLQCIVSELLLLDPADWNPLSAFSRRR